MSVREIRYRLIAVALGVCASGVAFAAEPQPVQAIWKSQEITFHFQSFTTYYSCTGLEAKLERLLRALGAREVRVRVSDPACPNVARMPRVEIHVVSPVEATAEAIAERDKHKPARELAARVQDKSDEARQMDQPFPAIWRPVSLSHGEHNLGGGDCDLIDQLRRKVLPKLAVRIVKDDLMCSPRGTTLGQPRLTVEALSAAPTPDQPQTQ